MMPQTPQLLAAGSALSPDPICDCPPLRDSMAQHLLRDELVLVHGNPLVLPSLPEEGEGSLYQSSRFADGTA